MTRQQFEWRHDDFSGGMIYRATPGNLRQNEVEWLENFDIFEQQFATKRCGFEPLNSVALDGPVQGLIEHFASDGTRFFIAAAAGKIYRQDNGDDSTFAIVDSGFDGDPSTRWFFIPWDDDLVLLNGVDGPLYYDTSAGTIAPLGGSPPVASCGGVLFRHLFLNSVTEPVRVYYSETNDPADGYFGKNYFFDAGVGDASRVTGFLTRDQEILIGKEKSITAVRGTNPRDFAQTQNRPAYTNTSGVVNAWTFFDSGEPWYLDTTGVFSIRAPFDTPEQSYWVDGLMDGISLSRIEKSFGLFCSDKSQAMVWLPRSSSPGDFTNIALVGHIGRGRGGLAAWSIYTGLVDITSGCVGAGTEVGDIVYLGDADGFVYRRSQREFLDGANPVSATLRTMHHTFRRPSIRKLYRESIVEIETGVETNLTLRVYVDRVLAASKNISVGGGGAFVLGTGLTGDALGGKVFSRQRVQHDERGIRSQVEIVSSDELECRVSAIEQIAYPTERRGIW